MRISKVKTSLSVLSLAVASNLIADPGVLSRSYVFVDKGPGDFILSRKAQITPENEVPTSSSGQIADTLQEEVPAFDDPILVQNVSAEDENYTSITLSYDTPNASPVDVARGELMRKISFFRDRLERRKEKILSMSNQLSEEEQSSVGDALVFVNSFLSICQEYNDRVTKRVALGNQQLCEINSQIEQKGNEIDRLKKTYASTPKSDVAKRQELRQKIDKLNKEISDRKVLKTAEFDTDAVTRIKNEFQEAMNAALNNAMRNANTIRANTNLWQRWKDSFRNGSLNETKRVALVSLLEVSKEFGNETTQSNVQELMREFGGSLSRETAILVAGGLQSAFGLLGTSTGVIGRSISSNIFGATSDFFKKLGDDLCYTDEPTSQILKRHAAIAEKQIRQSCSNMLDSGRRGVRFLMNRFRRSQTRG